MTRQPPVQVLLVRLAHELTSAAMYAASDHSDAALTHIRKAQELTDQLKEATA